MQLCGPECGPGIQCGPATGQGWSGGPMGKLTVNEIKSCLAKGSGTYQDGDGLILRVTAVGVGRWKLRVQHEGKRRDIGLGSTNLVTLAAARAKAAEARKAV